MSFHRRLWIICIAIGLLNQSAGWSREWHRTDGSLFCEGKLLSVENGKIRVLADTGATVLIPPNQLSLEDAEYVERALRSRAALVGERVASLPAAENPYDKPTVEPKPPAATPSVQTAGTSKPAAIEQDKFPLTNPNVTTWQGRPDPPAWDWTKPLDPANVDKLPSIKEHDGLLLPASNSPYVAIASASGNIWDLWDLRNGKQAGIVRGAPAANAKPTMSSDGRLLAAFNNREDAVEVWSFMTGNRVNTVALLDRLYSRERLSLVAGPGIVLQPTYEHLAI